ncbi:type IV secretion system protein VirB6 [Phenylobacterium sp. Root77]|jgi:type IV secretion system protein VirB6|uniref:type IV secretion system protein n=1 Tax=unclassified Phenylobacterium TaxID=2640670 RepID=UPI0006F77753|nr:MULTISPECIES: type IV secretion system protein [unclassified Phenylobacterium]KQW67026.1 type IV secretion system protein VirB6 [Phenylobacterium sp. Root1277]KQW89719.1 type IV secretion system protein VirB6 [Phenylobacterium sp. Root1290]KRC43592.1 type IV secretion system protein VirB6 [Phenylobacterium sp. Root77]
MSFTVFGPAYGFIDTKLDEVLNQGVSAMVEEVAGPTRLALVLYVMLYGFAILRGAIAEPLADFAVRSIKLAVIHTLTTSVAYGPWVADPLFRILPLTLARATSGGAAQDPGAAFDDYFSRAAWLGETIAQSATPMDLGPLFTAGVVFLAGALTAALGFGVVVLAKSALALMIALGPIFIACALFEATRRWFFGWLSQAVNYLVLFALILAVAQLVLALVAAQWAQIEAVDPMMAGLHYVALSILAGIFFLQTPAIASGIAGGASAGIADFATAGASAWRGAPAAPPARLPPSTSGSIRPTGTVR